MNFFIHVTRNYYLCDFGYTNGDGFLAPYRGVRYHMQEWNSCRVPPANEYEFFDKTNAKARNVIERSFGILKVRWAILRKMPIDPLEAESLEIDNPTNDPDVAYIEQVEPSYQWTNWRDNLARAMFQEWRDNH
ncbi:hypothetical protein BUALT_Bualt08G0024700 [Buddleja alternifolia]|uniref:DDE Tnp4 domain-containing protein n=1 Tax=Buddleja alternifolia TaxID=168488 RepID=A0AAV6XBL3_9LAMI|nr:hypothetical protein BUALT_Bualt08G0024700 [Buddleja alternifolia]